MKRVKYGLSVVLVLSMLIGILPAAMAAPSWRETLEAAGQAGLDVSWYPDYESLTRLYGTDRMLLQKNGLFALCDLGGTDFTGFVFDAVAQPSEDGTLLAMKNGKWGKIDQNGNTLVNFIYATQEEAKCPVNVQIVQKNGLFAIADLNGKLLTGYDYWNAKPFVNGYAALQNNEGRWGYIDGNGAVAVPFDYVGDISGMGDVGEDGYAIMQVVSKYYAVSIHGDDLLGVGMRKLWRAGQGMWGFVDGSGKVGFADSDGNVVVEAQYTYYTDPKGFLRGGFFDENGVAQVYTDFGDGARVLIDVNGNVLDSYPAESTIREDSQGLYMTEQVASVGPWGFVDESGELVIPYLFDAVGRFENGFASVRAGDVYGLLRHPLLYTEEELSLSALQEAGIWITWVETENNLEPLGRDQLVTEYKILGRGGMMGHNTWGDYGLRNVDGDLLRPVWYGTTLPGGRVGTNYFAVSETDGIYTDHLGNFFTAEDARGAWSAPELYTYREAGADGTLESGKYGYGDPWMGEKVLPAIYDEAHSFANGIGIVRVGEDRFAIDKAGVRLFDLNKYGETSIRFVNGYLRVRDAVTGKWGFLDTTGALAVPIAWDDTGEFSDGLVNVKKDGKWGYVDAAGELVVPCVLDEAGSVAGGVAVVKLGATQGIMKNPLCKDAPSFWAQEELAQAETAGYITLRCEDYPAFAITRLQFAELSVNWLEKATGKTIEPAPADTFTDTEDEMVRKAYAAGIVQGMGDGIFQPGGLLTREQLATMLWRAMKAAGVTAEKPADLTTYVDGELVSSWAQEGLSALVALNVMEGMGDNVLSPQSSCTVEQAILLAWRAAE